MMNDFDKNLMDEITRSHGELMNAKLDDTPQQTLQEVREMRQELQEVNAKLDRMAAGDAKEARFNRASFWATITVGVLTLIATVAGLVMSRLL